MSILKLFEPQSKVQKDRQIIRDTDIRMAKYGRRGLISNVLVYTLCLLVEQNFIQQYQPLAIVLTLGLILTTAVRGYLLFRMDTIYPRAPGSWRNKYFLATLVGAAWWGVTLGSVTLVMNMEGEASFMWLYTVVFFSTTAHAFAPYKRFLTIYQFLGIVPAACCTFFIGEFVGVFYGCVLLIFYWILNHHCDLIANSYWDRLEAQFMLAKKTESLEEEKRDTIASTQLTHDYLQLLRQKMQQMLATPQPTEGSAPPSPVTVASQRSALERIYRNVDDFCQVVSKDMTVQPHIFNSRHYLQHLIHGMVNEAERKGIELETALSPVLPCRLYGDPQRLGQIVTAMVRSSIQQAQGGVIFVEVEFLREYEAAGQLHVVIARQSESGKRLFFQGEPERGIVANLELILAKGVAEALKGHLDINESGSKDGKNLRLRLPLTMAEPNERPEYHRLRFKGRRLLLIHPNPRWLDHKRVDLDAMGFDVQTVNQFRKAFHALADALAQDRAVECVVYKAASGDEAPVQFCNDLLSHADLKYVQQFVICSDIGRQYFEDREAKASPLIHFINKPSGIFEFEVVASRVFEEHPTALEPVMEGPCRVLWLGPGGFLEHTQPLGEPELHIHRVADARAAVKALEEDDFRMVVVESSGVEDLEPIRAIRSYEQESPKDALVTILGVGSASAEAGMLAAGVDHFIDAETLVASDLHELRYWSDGRHH